MRVVAFVVLLSLAGCAPQLKGASEAGGIITHSTAGSASRSFKLAQDYCAKSGKQARVSGKDVLDSTLTFDCV